MSPPPRHLPLRSANFHNRFRMFALNVSPGSSIRCVRIDHRLDLRGFSLCL